ncbi:hypothetical protein UA44_23670 [Klebsiella aerogenes]|nr:hypothetical protein UA44_23670 [Klebsiella aerogenes]
MIKMDAAARFLRYSPLAFVISLLTGCALIQDDPGEVPIVNPQQAQLAQVIHLANSGWPAARWWEGYHDPQLNMLVNRALQNSPTMQAARLRHLTVTIHRRAGAVGNGRAGDRRGGAEPDAYNR